MGKKRGTLQVKFNRSRHMPTESRWASRDMGERKGRNMGKRVGEGSGSRKERKVVLNQWGKSGFHRQKTARKRENLLGGNQRGWGLGSYSWNKRTNHK